MIKYDPKTTAILCFNFLRGVSNPEKRLPTPMLIPIIHKVVS